MMSLKKILGFSLLTLAILTSLTSCITVSSFNQYKITYNLSAKKYAKRLYGNYDSSEFVELSYEDTMDKISLLSLKVKDFDLSNTISGLFLEINKDESTYYLLLGLEMSIEINSDVSCTLNVGHITDYFTLKVSPSNKTMLFNYPPSKKEFDWRCSFEF